MHSLATGKPTGTFAFERIVFPAMGYMTSVSFSDDKTAYARTDEGVFYRLAPNAVKWEEFARIGANIPDAFYTFPGVATEGDFVNCAFEVAVHATNSQHVALAWNQQILRASDGGASFAITNFPTTAKMRYYGNNDLAVSTSRFGRRRMEYDPANTAVLAIGIPKDGVWYTTNFATTATWTKHPDIPASTHMDGVSLAFDRSSGTTSGRTNKVVAHVHGVGTFVSSTTITGSFAQLSGGPTTANDLFVANGNIYIASEADGRFWKHDGTSWTWEPAVGARTVCVKPGSPASIYGMTAGGGILASTSSGATGTYASLGLTVMHCDDGPALASTKTFTPKGRFSDIAALSEPGMARFFPGTSRLLVLTGIGAFYVDNPSTVAAAQVDAYSISSGIENLVNMDFKATKKRFLYTCHDRGGFGFNKTPEGLRTAPGRNHPFGMFTHAHSVDYAIDDEDFVVFTSFKPSYQPGGITTYDQLVLSRDGLRTVEYPEGTLPLAADGVTPFYMGNIAVGNKDNWVLTSASANGQGGRVAFTKDGGKTFAYSTFVGGSDVGWWVNFYFHDCTRIVADKENPGTFFAYAVGDTDTDNSGKVGMWKSTDGGETFTKIRSGRLNPINLDFYNGKLRKTPGRANDLWWVYGGQGNVLDTPGAGGIRFSSDAFASQNVHITSLYEPQDIALGPNLKGRAYPAVWATAWGSAALNDYGLFLCVDWDPVAGTGTFDMVARFPLGVPGIANRIWADPDRFGVIYYGHAGLGMSVGRYTSMLLPA